MTRQLSFVITSVYKSDKQIQDVLIIWGVVNLLSNTRWRHHPPNPPTQAEEAASAALTNGPPCAPGDAFNGSLCLAEANPTFAREVAGRMVIEYRRTGWVAGVALAAPRQQQGLAHQHTR